MNPIVIGATGFVGNHLMRRLGCPGTSRRGGLIPFDLLAMDFSALEPFDTVYLCAAMNGAKACEGSQEAFVANVDAPIELARSVRAFVVWIGSMGVEWFAAGAYQRHKLTAETVLRTMPNVGIVRAGRILASNLDDLTDTLIRVGANRMAGVTRWGNEDMAYAKA